MRNIVGGVFLTVFALIWTGGVGAFDGVLVWSVCKQQQAKGWPATSAVVTRSEMVTSRSRKGGTTYRALIEYEYVADGRARHSDRHSFGIFDFSSSQKLADDVLARFPLGATVQARYNPADPSEATLQVGLVPGTLFVFLFMTPFNCVLIGLWWYGGAYVLRSLARPVCGGLRMVEDEGMTLIRVAWVSPLMAGLLCTGLLGFASVFVSGVFMKGAASLSTAGITIAVVYGLGVGVGLYCYLFGARWNKYIVIDPGTGTVTIPPLGSRKTEETMRLPDIRKIGQRSVTRGKSTTTYLCIESSERDDPLEWEISMGSDRLRGLTAYLSERAGIMKTV